MRTSCSQASIWHWRVRVRPLADVVRFKKVCIIWALFLLLLLIANRFADPIFWQMVKDIFEILQYVRQVSFLNIDVMQRIWLPIYDGCVSIQRVRLLHIFLSDLFNHASDAWVKHQSQLYWRSVLLPLPSLKMFPSSLALHTPRFALFTKGTCTCSSNTSSIKWKLNISWRDRIS